MSTESKTCCDCCDKQLNEDTNYPHAYGIRLSSHDYKPRGGPARDVFMLMMHPALEKNYDFCGFQCLGEWLLKKGEAKKKQGKRDRS